MSAPLVIAVAVLAAALLLEGACIAVLFGASLLDARDRRRFRKELDTAIRSFQAG